MPRDGTRLWRGILLAAVTGLACAGLPAAAEVADAAVTADAADEAYATYTGDGHDLTLQTALQLAEQRSHGLQRAAAAVEGAAAGADAARAQRLPQVSATVSATLLSDPPEGVRIRRGSLGSTEAPGTTFPVPLPDEDVVLVPDAERTFYRLEGVLEQPLFTWGKLSRGERVAVLDRDLADIELQQSRRELRRDTMQAYYGTRFAADAVTVLRNAEAIAEQILADRELALEVGTVNQEDLLEARAELQELRMQRRRAEQALASAETGLGTLLQQPITATRLVSDFPDRPELPPEAGLYQQALSDSHDLELLRGRLQQARLGTEVEQRSSMWRPDVALQLQLEAGGQRLPPQANWYDSWDVGVNLTLAGRFGVYDGGAQAAAVRQAESRERQLQASIAELRDGLAYEVRLRREEVVARREEHELNRLRLELAEERARNARVSFENDLITRAEERGAQILLELARLSQLRSRYQLEQAYIELDFLTGSLPGSAP
ncbi:TolC family protein [Spirochaeta africana]|uniref:Outer membrane protein n=1 Tax=Spirochaeta africana (strain ATCC 700263 / DSM 8902 / Z-7692) TaxID=889378 RepID=H9UFB5_SPIAZ|nr:TolC family protein [Spirochaeta africana]AFG36208.1 outer membrane protein [Spirochaeta africana DSM 8902]